MEPVEQPQPPPQLRKKCGACISVRVRQWSGSLQPLPPTYPTYTIPEDPQMGGPSSAEPVVELHPQPFAQQPPLGFDNPMPTYPDLTGYGTSYSTVPMDFNYPSPSYDPYMQAIMHNALYPSPFTFAYPNTGYPNYGYQYPIVPQPQPQPLPQLQAINKALERAEQIQHQAEWNQKRTSEFFKKLTKLVKGKKDK
ncbi:hypothetical protein Hanom_Chr06g00509301 [Helianthus anomalus]